MSTGNKYLFYYSEQSRRACAHWERLVILSGFRCRRATDFPPLPPFFLPYPFLPLCGNNFRDEKCASPRILHLYTYVYTSRCKLEGLLLFDSMNNYIQNFEKFQVYYKKNGARKRGQCSRRTQCAEPSHSNSNSIRSLMNFCRGPLSVWLRSRYANSYPRGAHERLQRCGAPLLSPIAVASRKVAFRFEVTSSLVISHVSPPCTSSLRSDI